MSRSPSRRFPLRWLTHALVTVLAFQVAAPTSFGEDEAPPPTPSLRTLDKAWSKAKKTVKAKFSKALYERAESLKTHQMQLVREVIGAADLNMRRVPKRLGAPFYDPRRHTPKEPIKRKVAKEGSSVARNFQRRVFSKIPAREFEPAWEYDYGAGEVVQIVEDPDDPERLFQNAMGGYPPQLDLAEALLEMKLDDGSQKIAAAAFGHGYSDRNGTGYPEITIYDAWCSGIQIEMPDVECLGIVHDVLDDWKTWKAPIAGNEQRQLYTTIEGLFTDLRRFRGLRHALTRTYFNGQAVLRDDYDSQLGTFQALWTVVGESPDTLAASLPGPDGWRDWLIATAQRIDEDEDYAWDTGQQRLADLEADRQAVRDCLALAMRDCGILD